MSQQYNPQSQNSSKSQPTPQTRRETGTGPRTPRTQTK